MENVRMKHLLAGKKSNKQQTMYITVNLFHLQMSIK